MLNFPFYPSWSLVLVPLQWEQQEHSPGMAPGWAVPAHTLPVPRTVGCCSPGRDALHQGVELPAWVQVMQDILQHPAESWTP